jgi:uncharacterized protein (DUF362 family)
MKDRRDFLKRAATGAVLLGSQGTLGLADMFAQSASAARSRVVVAHDAALNASGAQPSEKSVLALLDKAMASYTGRDKPEEAWKRVIAPQVLRGGVIGLKVNGLGGRGISTHAELVMAICERLQQAGVAPGNIVVWDRNARDLVACRLTINASDRSRVRCFGSDVAGFEDQQESWGIAKIRLSKILTRECAMVISLPILKDHDLAGMTFSMKNMYGVVDRPDHLHGNSCNPAVADLNCIAAIRQKVTLTIGDALKSVYQGGPAFRPEHSCYPNSLVVGEDRVAVDHVALKILNSHRVQNGLETLEAAGRAPVYIATAADAAHKLGTNDSKRIHMLEV